MTLNCETTGHDYLVYEKFMSCVSCGTTESIPEVAPQRASPEVTEASVTPSEPDYDQEPPLDVYEPYNEYDNAYAQETSTY